MIKTIIKISGIILLAILQITLMPNFAIFNVWPNLILMAALALVFLEFDQEALLVASLGGLILDLANPMVFGYNLIILVGFVLLTKLLFARFITEPNIFLIAIYFYMASLVSDFILMIIVRDFLWGSFLINGIYSLIVGLIFYRFFEQWAQRSKLIYTGTK